MRKHSLFVAIFFSIYSSLAAAAVLEIDLSKEISLKDGRYLVKEYEGKGRYVLIDYSHGRFSSGSDIEIAVCTNGFVVSKLPAKFSNIKKHLKPTDYVLTECDEARD